MKRDTYNDTSTGTPSVCVNVVAFVVFFYNYHEVEFDNQGRCWDSFSRKNKKKKGGNKSSCIKNFKFKESLNALHLILFISRSDFHYGF